MKDEEWMRLALEEARKCLRATLISSPFQPEIHPSSFILHPSEVDDVPVGALCVLGEEIVGRGHNRREIDRDPTFHAEILALRDAAKHLNQHHLDGVTLYVTLEPCAMCAGAVWLSRVERVVFGAFDERAGACGSVFDVPRDPRLNHRAQVRGGVLEEECQEILRAFFAARR